MFIFWTGSHCVAPRLVSSLSHVVQRSPGFTAVTKARCVLCSDHSVSGHMALSGCGQAKEHARSLRGAKPAPHSGLKAQSKFSLLREEPF